MNTSSHLILQKMITKEKIDSKDSPEEKKHKSQANLDASIQIIKDWHEKLQKRHDWRNKLRRAGNLEALILTEGFRALSTPFRDWLEDIDWRWRYHGLALAAGIAAHVETIDEQRSFAAQLGKPSPGSDKPPLSVPRFTRLCQANNEQEMYNRMRRAVQRLNWNVNLPSMVDGILLWSREQDEKKRLVPFERDPFERLAVRWACEYYQATEMTEE